MNWHCRELNIPEAYYYACTLTNQLSQRHKSIREKTKKIRGLNVQP